MMFLTRSIIAVLASLVCLALPASKAYASTLNLEVPFFGARHDHTIADMFGFALPAGRCEQLRLENKIYFGEGITLDNDAGCLPAPCARVLTRQEVSQIIGREASAAEWKQYNDRFGDVCCPGAIALKTDEEHADALANFWPEFVTQAVQRRSTVAYDGFFSGFSSSILGGSSQTPSGTFGDGFVATPLGGTGTAGNDPFVPLTFLDNPAPNNVTPIPLPAGVMLMLGGIGIIVAARRTK